MFEPFVAIIVPCFNASATIVRTVNSILNSTYANYEVILVNDGSRDDTLQLLQDSADRDNRFTVVDQPNQGVSSARNNGVAHTSAEYIAFLDADDIYLENSLSDRMRVFVQEDDANMIGVYCPSFMLGENLEILRNEPLFNHNVPQNRLYFSSLNDSAFNPSSVILKRSEFIRVGGFDETLCPAEDFEFWHRIMRNGGYFRKVDSCCIGWVQHPASASHANIQKHYDQCKKVFKSLNSTTDRHSIMEFQHGLGDTVYHKSLSQKALTSSLMAAVIGQTSTAFAISRDIKKIFLEQMYAVELVDTIKFCAMRALCRPETEWPDPLWPMIRENVLRFLIDLSEHFDRSCHVLSIVIKHLETLAAPGAMPVNNCPPQVENVNRGEDSIELLPVALINDHRDIAELIYRKSSELQVELGWHYVLDLIWIISNIRALPHGSVVLDAGAGNGLLQFILADMGYKVISADYAERVVPQHCLARYNILRVDSGKEYDNEYIRHISREFGSQQPIQEQAALLGTGISEQIARCTPGTILYYKVDICNMEQVDDASIDCVVSVSALEHNDEKTITAAVSELQRVLKPDHRMLLTVSAAEDCDWYHEQSRGWCFTDKTMIRLFSLSHPRSNFHNYSGYFQDLLACDYLQRHLDPGYAKSGNNGMPWGVWHPRYQPVGISKVNTGPAPRRAKQSAPTPPPRENLHAGPPPLMSALIDTTDGCNLHCTFCSRENSKIQMMSTDNFRLILDKLAPHLSALQLCCAWEYSIAPNAHEIVRALGNYCIQTTTIYTNGQTLPLELAESIIDARISNLVFSIGEAKKATYEQIRRGGSFEKILGNIEMVKKLKEQRGVSTPRLCANLTVINSNIGELPDFVTLAAKLGISEIRGRHLILNEGMDMDDEVIRDISRANEILDIAQKRAAGHGIDFQIPPYSGREAVKNCQAPWTQLYVSSNGDVAVCPRIHKYEKIGNLLDQGLESLLTGTERREMQRQMQMVSFNNPVCGICMQNKETEVSINQGF